METVYRDYSPKGVKFYYIYKALAHPELNGYVNPFTLGERLMHAKEAQRRIGSKIPWICDSMSNEIKHALGNANNSEFVINPDGRIVRMRSWSNPGQLRRDLEELVGRVDTPTTISDLGMKTPAPVRTATARVTPVIQTPDRMQPVKVRPVADKTPFYVKLRAEVDGQLLRTGSGKMYLGFHLDPLYRVHWNNLVNPVHYEIKPPAGTVVSPASGDGPKIKEASDTDPREFLVDVNNVNSKEPIELTVKYFACTDEWCIPVTQRYSIYLERDPDGGVVMSRNGPTGRGRGFPGGGPGGRGFLGEPGVPGSGLSNFEQVLKGLDLSEKQRGEAIDIVTSYRKKSRDLFLKMRDGEIGFEDIRSGREKLNQEMMNQMRGVLSEEQYKRFEKAAEAFRPMSRRPPG